ncbi:MAG: helix-turn-helix domain-containing protein [Lachnospiraceae bacterium]|nr:helix-turn-helix domain-containing protein [Lachnospiraceae bacterium]
MRKRKEINVLVGNQIRIVRESAGLTQEQFGDLVSLGPKNISDIERGNVGISVSTLKRICETLSVSSDRILFGDQKINELEYLRERLELLPEEQFSIVEAFLNQMFHLFGMLGK